MDSTTLINAIIFAAIFVVFRMLNSYKESQKRLEQSLSEINKSLGAVMQYAQASDRIENNTIEVLNQICQALTEYFKTCDVYMNDTGYAIQNLIVCMVPLMDDMKECAVHDEEYEKAAELDKLIASLQDIITQQSITK